MRSGDSYQALSGLKKVNNVIRTDLDSSFFSCLETVLSLFPIFSLSLTFFDFYFIVRIESIKVDEQLKKNVDRSVCLSVQLYL